MKPVFIDFHIHTSEDPENLDESYDLATLKSKLEDVATVPDSFHKTNRINVFRGIFGLKSAAI